MMNAQPAAASRFFQSFNFARPETELREAIDAWTSYIDDLASDAERDQRYHALVAHALLLRAVAFAALKEHEAAIADLQRIIDGQQIYGIEEVHTARMTLGGIYCEQGQDDQAIAAWSALLTEYEQASRKEAKQYPAALPMLYLYRGMMHGRQERYQEAIADCDRAIKTLPDFAEARSVRGVSYAYLGNLDQGLADCQRAVELEPQRAVHLSRLGEVHLQRREYKQALEVFGRAISLDPADEHLQMQKRKALGYCLFSWCDDLFLAEEVASDEGQSRAEGGQEQADLEIKAPE